MTSVPVSGALFGDGRRADHLQRRLGLAMAEAHVMSLAVAPDAQVEMFRQGVDHRDADAVQTARDLVGILVELTAGMQLGHDDLGSRYAFFLVDIGGNAAPIVADRHRAVGVQDHLDPVAMAGQGFVDGVVHHLIDHVMQTRPVVGVADIHARALTHRIESAQNLNGVRAIFLCGFGGGGVLAGDLTGHRLTSFDTGRSIA